METICRVIVMEPECAAGIGLFAGRRWECLIMACTVTKRKQANGFMRADYQAVAVLQIWS
ncbi:hypothetical protein AO287_22680 [Pseudomonas savastanoi]|uniref:Uncharacterized protein n=1 Tax=Pseudomonas savastanoi TaxID=29438 RepID=A0AAW3LZZ2_PSESS|nr:hypothetical protein AO287_22680 [Pseudomonas savastanoi]